MPVTLTDTEAKDLIRMIRIAVEAIEDGSALPALWASEATDWCWLIADRLTGGTNG